jgi:peroxin-3
MQHILIQGGIPPHRATHHTLLFDSLLKETRAIIASSDFSRVLEVSLDQATETLFDGLHKNVFVESGNKVDESGQELRLRLAGLLPGLARWCHLALDGLPNELVDVSLSFLLPPFIQIVTFGWIGPDGCERGGGTVCDSVLEI